MKIAQQELPFRRWGGARKGAGRKRQSPRASVPHVPRQRFNKGALHVTLRIRREVWNLRTHRCFRALQRAFVEAPDAEALARAMKGIEVRMARALNKEMDRVGAVFADRYHAHLLVSPREAA